MLNSCTPELAEAHCAKAAGPTGRKDELVTHQAHRPREAVLAQDQVGLHCNGA